MVSAIRSNVYGPGHECSIMNILVPNDKARFRLLSLPYAPGKGCSCTSFAPPLSQNNVTPRFSVFTTYKRRCRFAPTRLKLRAFVCLRLRPRTPPWACSSHMKLTWWFQTSCWEAYRAELSIFMKQIRPDVSVVLLLGAEQLPRTFLMQVDASMEQGGPTQDLLGCLQAVVARQSSNRERGAGIRLEA